MLCLCLYMPCISSKRMHFVYDKEIKLNTTEMWSAREYFTSDPSGGRLTIWLASSTGHRTCRSAMRLLILYRPNGNQLPLYYNGSWKENTKKKKLTNKTSAGSHPLMISQLVFTNTLMPESRASPRCVNAYYDQQNSGRDHVYTLCERYTLPFSLLSCNLHVNLCIRLLSPPLTSPHPPRTPSRFDINACSTTTVVV